MVSVSRILPVISLSLLLTASGGQRRNTQDPHLSVRTDPLYSFRILSTRFRGNEGIFRSCVIVYPDGRFRLERSKEDMSGIRRRSAFQISLGALTESEIDRAFDLIADEALLAHKNSRLAGVSGFPPPRLINAEIPRDAYQTQQVIAEIPDAEAPPPDVKLLVDFLDELDARDPAISDDAKPTNCRRPPARPM